MSLSGFTIGSGADPAAPGASTALKGFNVGATAPTTPAPKDTSLSGFKGPAAAPIAPAKPADTSSLFSRFLNFASDKISSAIAPPDLTKNPTPSALQYLPSELARQIPGVADLQDDPELANFVTAKDTAKEIPGAALDVAKGFAKAPIEFGASLFDAGRAFAGADPKAKFNIPGLGEITSLQFQAAEAVQQGQNPWAASFNLVPSTIFDTLFFTDIVSRVAGPRAVKIGETNGKLPNNMEAPAPKTGRLSETPTAGTHARIAPPELAAKLKQAYGEKFDAKQPTFFKATFKGDTFKGEVFQLRPSYLRVAFEKATGGKSAPFSVPDLLGEPLPRDPAVLQKIADEAGPNDIVSMQKKSVTGKDIASGINEKVMSISDVTPAAKPTQKAPPTPPTVAHTVAHNVLRLGKGDVSGAKDGEQHLLDGIKESLAEHGPDVTSIQLQEKVGVDAQTAQRLIAEAKAHKTAAEEAAIHKSVTAKILGERDDASIKADAIKHVADNQSALIDQYIKAHGNVVGADEAKEFLPGYSADRSISDLVAKGAAQMTDALYNHLIEKSDGKPVLMTGGGTGVGKSTATSGLNPKDFTVVFDSNSSNLPSAIARIDKALEKGLTVDFRFVYAPVDRAYDRVLDRAHLMAEEKGSGRPVSAQGHIDMHHGSQDMLPGLIEHYKDNPNVHIHIIDNSGTEAKAVSKPLDFIRKIADNRKDANELHQDLIKQRQAAVHERRLSEKANTAFDRAELLRPKKDNGGNVEGNKEPQERKDALTQKEKVAQAVKDQALSIKEVAKLTKILEPNVRRILGQGAKDGTFERVAEGVYVLKTSKGNFAYVEVGDAVESLARMAEEGQKFDAVILDPAYYSRALIGGNRGIKVGKVGGWDQFIIPPEFANLMGSLAKVMTNEDSHVYLMLAGARTAQVDMDKYVQGAVDAGFKVVGEGKYMKSNKDGSPVTNVRGQVAAGERLILMTQSGTAREGEIPVSLEFQFIRPSITKSYQTEKPAELMKALIEQSTLDGETVLDPFGGSGVTGAEALKSGRNAVLVEKSEESVKNFTKPRVEAAAAAIDKEGERGFVAPQKIAEDVAAKAAQMKDFIDETSEKIEVTAHTSDDLYKLENNAKRDLEIAIRLIRELKPDPRDMEAIYHYEEDKGIELTEKQQQIYDAVIKPLADTSAEIFSRLKNAGLPMTNEDYTPRFVKGKGNVLDRLMDAYEKGKSAVSTNQGGALSKTTGSMKHRTMKSIVDENGNRTVVSIKNQQFTTETGKKVMSKRVTAFRGNKPEDMGRFSTKTKEEVMNTEVEPVQREIKKIQKEIDRLVAQNESRQPVTASMLKTLSDKIDTMIQYVDSNVGAFTRKELAPDIRKIQDKSVEYNALAKVKQSIDQMKQIRNDRLVTLQGQMVSLVNKVGEIEGSYNPHELNDQVFTDKNGKAYTIAEATTKEIELHTKLEYHKNVIANRILQYLKLRQIERANQFIEDFKSHPDFSDIAVKVGEEAPSNYKITSLPQFRGYVMEPRIAETFDRFNEKMQTPNGLLATLAPINRFLRNAIFFNPLIHVPNITVHWLTNRGALRLANPAAYIRGAQSFARAWNAVVKRNEDYITALEQGAPLLASEASSRELGKVLLETMTKELEGNPDTASKVAAALGYANPANLIRAVYKFSGKFTWTVNDLLTMQAVYEDMAEKGVSLEKAITETGKHIPNYRIPERIFDKALTVTTGEEVGGNISHGLASMMQNPNLSMFGAYHYGALRSYGEIFSDFVKKGNSIKDRARALDKLAMLALIGLVLYPYVLDRIARAITGNPNAKMRRAGGTTLPNNVHEFLLGTKDAGQVFQSVVTPSPIAKMIPELVWNKDFWNDSQVYGAGGEGFLNFVADQISPIQQARNLSTGRMTPVNFFASLGGISSPKSTDSEKEVTSMIYQEKPALLKQMKALVAGGDEAGAREIAHEFNTRLQSSIKQSLIDNGKSGSDAQVQYIFKSNAVRMPSQKVMDNYNATQGLSWVDKVFAKGTKPVLPNDKPMENDSFIHGILVYANAIATDPQTAMTNILHGQVIRKVDNGTVIVRRMSLADSQAIKTAEGGNNPTMKLDHTIPLQLGGTNEESNLSLVPTEQWASYTPVENYLGKALRAGTIDKGTAQKYMTDFKSGILTFDDIKSSI